MITCMIFTISRWNSPTQPKIERCSQPLLGDWGLIIFSILLLLLSFGRSTEFWSTGVYMKGHQVQRVKLLWVAIDSTSWWEKCTWKIYLRLFIFAWYVLSWHFQCSCSVWNILSRSLASPHPTPPLQPSLNLTYQVCLEIHRIQNNTEVQTWPCRDALTRFGQIPVARAQLPKFGSKTSAIAVFANRR